MVGVPGAVLLGLGSILGTGIFVSVGLAADVAGARVLPAIVLGGLLAACNGLSSAQLAARHPVSGGTYEYGYRLLHPALGFSAGWMFLCAKSASAATAALGFAGYLLGSVGVLGGAARGESIPAASSAQAHALAWPVLGVALLAVAALTWLVRSGLRRSNRINALLVSVSVAALGGFVVWALSLPPAARTGDGVAAWLPSDLEQTRGLLHATALMFVAYTGYGRIATLGEEIRDPARNIPRAMLWTLGASLLLYVGVAAASVSAVGAEALARATEAGAAPLATIARALDAPLVASAVSLGAMIAMLGVLLNLILGLSRVVLAMSRRGDLPASGAKLDGPHASPRRAVLWVGCVVAALTALGRLELAWSLSAFTVLVYYAITNLAALRLAPEERLYPRWVSLAGLGGCVFLVGFIPLGIWAVGLGLLALGGAVHLRARAVTR